MKLLLLFLLAVGGVSLPSFCLAAPITKSLTFYDRNDEIIGDGWYTYDLEIKTSAVDLCSDSLGPELAESVCGYYGDLVLVQNAYIDILGYEFGKPYANYALGGVATGGAFEVDTRYQTAGFHTYWRWADYAGDYFNISTDGNWTAPRIPELRTLAGTYEVTQVPLPGAMLLFLVGLPILRWFIKPIRTASAQS